MTSLSFLILGNYCLSFARLDGEACALPPHFKCFAFIDFLCCFHFVLVCYFPPSSNVDFI